VQAVQRVAEHRWPDGLPGDGHGALRPHLQGGRGQQLGDVGGQEERRRRQLAEPEVDQPHRAVRRKEDVGEAQVAMGDAVLPQAAHLLPDRRQHAVGDLVGLQPIEAAPLDGLVGKDERVRLAGGERHQSRRADAKVTRRQCHQRLVLDAAPERREGALVAEVAAVDVAIEAEQQVGAALVLAERLHEQRPPAAPVPK
jgi:hypothetical protein